eukprot:TRINITY_DN7946_c0_g1_i2.p1 TRINITY_DN7946_c0_g1~~TRINITY_DN7946_c0_g1_i2.p1  ORF type:complete len:358 (-),score=121.96 TRINITY_DN7946_c0_g1_i2:179-1252(-)
MCIRDSLPDVDDLWVEYRYKHITEAMSGITSRFDDFVANNSNARLQRGDADNMDLSKMSDILKGMPMYNELLAKYTLHMNLIDECNEKFNAKEIKEVAEIEQSLATGIDGAGKSVSQAKIMAQVVQRITSGKLTDDEVLRLLITAVTTLELTEKDRKTLTSSLPPEDQRAVQNLIWMGISAQRSGGKKTQARVDELTKAKAKNKLKNMSFDLCRSTPLIEHIVLAVENQNFDRTKFESIVIPAGADVSGKKGVTSLRKKNMKSNWDDGGDEKAKPKIIVVVVGGMTYAEIRAVKELERKKTDPRDAPKIDSITIVGGTAIMKPSDYVQGFRNMLTISEYEDLTSRSGGFVSLEIGGR